jgi:hypothetical protein
MTAKREQPSQGEQSAEVNEEEPKLDLKVMYEQLLKSQDAIRAAAKAQGITLEEPPPGDMIVAYKETETGTTGPVRPGAATDPKGLNWKPWTKADIDASGDEKHSFVPQFIPALVHPLLDENRRARIIFDINDLKCCLTVGVLNENISGTFYYAYMDAEKEWANLEAFKQNGPVSGPHTRGGVAGANTWHYEPEAPSAWIDLAGNYYKPGAVMPGQSETTEE